MKNYLTIFKPVEDLLPQIDRQIYSGIARAYTDIEIELHIDGDMCRFDSVINYLAHIDIDGEFDLLSVEDKMCRGLDNRELLIRIQSSDKNLKLFKRRVLLHDIIVPLKSRVDGYIASSIMDRGAGDSEKLVIDVGSMSIDLSYYNYTESISNNFSNYYSEICLIPENKLEIKIY